MSEGGVLAKAAAEGEGESKGPDAAAEAGKTKALSAGILDTFKLIDRKAHPREIPKTNLIVSGRV